MRQQQVLCIIIDHDPAITHLLAAALRSSEYAVQVVALSSWHDLLAGLRDQQPALLFTPPLQKQSSERKLLNLLRAQSPDTVLVHAAARRWRHIQAHASGVESCMIATANEDVLLQQIDFLLRYAQLKNDFRHCKQFLSIAELRCQWLMDYSREAIAYIARGRHLHANLEYLALFGFESAHTALETPLASLVDAKERAAFAPLQRDAATTTRVAGKTLVTLQRTDRQLFRAEVRFIPSVFRGKRCLQVHVHPLDPGVSRVALSAAAQKQLLERKQHNNRTRILSSVDLHSKGAGAANTLKMPGKPAIKSGLYAQFDEALNLKMHKQSALLFAEPVLKNNNGRLVDYPLVTRQLGQRGDKRFKLDLWNVRKAIMRIERDHKRRDGFCVYIALGHWVLRDKSGIQRLFSMLRDVPESTRERLILALPFEVLKQYRHVLGALIQQLRHTRVKLAMDEFTGSRQSIELALIMGVWGVRASTRFSGRVITHDGHVDRQFQQMMQRLDDKEIAMIVSGVENLAALNALCMTSAAYLQGSILNEFSQKRSA